VAEKPGDIIVGGEDPWRGHEAIARTDVANAFFGWEAVHADSVRTNQQESINATYMPMP